MIYGLIDLVQLASTVFSFLIIARVVLSWVNPNPRNPLVAIIDRTTEPALLPVRRILPAFSGIDLSPLVVLLGVQFLTGILVRFLYQMA